MLTEKDYCDYETCVALKELGFNNLVNWYFNEEKSIVSSLARYRNTYIPRISLYEAQKWLREEKDIHIEIDRIGYPTGYGWQVSIIEMEYNLCESVINNNKSYEEALSEGLRQSVKILKENEDE